MRGRIAAAVPIAGTCIALPTFGCAMDDKTLNLWRQIENGRRQARERPPGRAKPLATPMPQGGS